MSSFGYALAIVVFAAAALCGLRPHLMLAHRRLLLPDSDTPQPQHLFDCYMLSSNASAETRVLFAGVDCKIIPATAFSEAQFADVHPAVQNILAGRASTFSACVLSNNNSVNIFANHVKIWQLVVQGTRPAVILEDDALASYDFPSILSSVVSSTFSTHTNSTDFNNTVLKLHNHNTQSISDWTIVKAVNGVSILRSACSDVPATSTLAYIIDPAAAATLIRWHKPIIMHVDFYLYEMACMHKITLLSTRPYLVSENGRPSLHRPYKSFYDWVKEIISSVIYFTHRPMCFATFNASVQSL